MENYNRLFLLQPAGDDFDQMKDQILNDQDVTEPGEFAGKVSLGQLNAYSGELKAQALSNFKTIKIDKADGSASETNLAKLLLELQGEGGVEDAKEEANIAADSKIADIEALSARNEMEVQLAGLLHEASYAAMGDLESHEEVSHTVYRDGFQESDIVADGTATQFVTEGRYSKAGFICLLNGVVQTAAEGGNIETDELDIVGFDFINAPVVGDIVSFRFDSDVNDDIAVSDKGLKQSSDTKGDNLNTFTTYETSAKADEAAKMAEVKSAKEASAAAEAAANTALAEINSAQAEISSANSVNEVDAAMTALQAGIDDYVIAETDITNHGSTVMSAQKDFRAIGAAMTDAKDAHGVSDKALDAYSLSYQTIKDRAESAEAKIDSIINPPAA